MSNRINGKKWRDLREEVFRHYGRACSYCGYEDTVMTIDHILPRSKGGDNSLENLLPACRKCNYSRGNRLVGFFEQKGTPPTLHEVFIPQNESISHD
jgi:5-methylcytosine-specific restriction endonuclease McrA